MKLICGTNNAKLIGKASFKICLLFISSRRSCAMFLKGQRSYIRLLESENAKLYEWRAYVPLKIRNVYCQLPVVSLMSANEWVQKIKYYCGLDDKASIQYHRSRYYRGNQFT